MKNENRSNECCDGCRYVLIVRLRLKNHPDNDSAEGVSTGERSITDLLKLWEDIQHGPSYGAENAFFGKKVYAFSPDGKQDRMTSDSKYVLLVKVIRVCDLFNPESKLCVSFHEYQTPQALHKYFGACKDHALKNNTTVAFAFHLKKTT
jgi:hypothetical protein